MDEIFNYIRILIKDFQYTWRYYWHYPIEHSDAPLYCYLYKQCAAGDKEPEVAMVVGGRHPGHYFITKVWSERYEKLFLYEKWIMVV